VQFAQRGGRRIPVHGGLGDDEGILNFVNYAPNRSTTEPDAPIAGLVPGSRFLTIDGYPVNRGSSFVMAMAFTDAGPRARAVLTYGQSGDPASPHFADQTALFSRKAWRDILFTEDAIRADKGLQTKTVRGRR
jgi:acyl-homoserine-lactone acylase